MKFIELTLSDDIKDALDNIGYIEATPIQSEAIPLAVAGYDLIGQAQTGTGKTFSFGLPMIEKLRNVKTAFSGLIICPTRELAIQVNEELRKITKQLKGIKTAVIYGGQAYPVQLRALKDNPQIVIGTPGRIIDHLDRGSLNFENLQMLIMDEADEMLKMGFEEDLTRILKGTPESKQTLLFSATMPENIRKIASNYLQDPKHIKIQAKELTVDRIEQVYYEVSDSSKFDLLIRLLDFYSFRSSIIFCNTKKGVDELAAQLEKYSYRSDALHGDLSQHQRDRVMNNFRNKNLDVLVATDVAARGLDVKEVDVVFNYDMPQEEEFYVHRIGRTGRAGREGKSIAFVTSKQRGRLKMIEKYAKTTIKKLEIPTPKEVEDARLLNQFDRIIEAIDFEKGNDLHAALTNHGLSDKQIINGLINTLVTEKRQYPEIDVPRNRDEDRREGRTRNRERDRERTRSNKGGKGRDGFLVLNIGKAEKLRPQILLSYLRTKTNLDAAFVGDIKIKNKETFIEVKGNVENFERTLNSKVYQGKKLFAKEVKNMG